MRWTRSYVVFLECFRSAILGEACIFHAKVGFVVFTQDGRRPGQQATYHPHHRAPRGLPPVPGDLSVPVVPAVPAVLRDPGILAVPVEEE